MRIEVKNEQVHLEVSGYGVLAVTPTLAEAAWPLRELAFLRPSS